MTQAERLKNISVKMREAAWKEIDADEEFKSLDVVEQELIMLGLWNHGFNAQTQLLERLYNINMSDITTEELI